MFIQHDRILSKIFNALSVIFLILLFPTVGMAQRLNSVPDSSQEPPTNRLIIKYKTQTTAFSAAFKTDQMQRLNSKLGIQLRYLRSTAGNAHILLLPRKMPIKEVKEIVNKLIALPEVEYAEPDKILFLMRVSNDPWYGNQWHYFNSIGGINLPLAWDTTIGINTIKVAVIDTGITNHIDLATKTVPGYDFISDPFIANDGNGRDNDPTDPGDWVTTEESNSGPFQGCWVSDSSWHGTHVAGTIGALSNNKLGVTGVDWNAKIQPIRVLGKCGGYTSDISDGMLWAAGLPVSGVPNNPTPSKVLNLSLGGFGACGPTFQNAINSINAKGAVVVVAAGNNNIDASKMTPANCSGVIVVAATNKSGNKAYYSNFGSAVTISAPGGEQAYDNDPNGILSTLNMGTQGPEQDSYVYYQGTSMAAPHISGIVSLIFSKKPKLTPTQIRTILQSTAKPFPVSSNCTTSICGRGIADANASIIKALDIKTLTLTSLGAYDGLILESSEYSGLGKYLNSTSTLLYIGDDLYNRQYRPLLTFNTSALPDNAIITKVILKIRFAGTSGTNPFITHGALLADIRKPFFGNNIALELVDFAAAPNKLNAAAFNKVPVNNIYSSIFSNSVLRYINLTGTTQIRLHFNLDDNNDKGTDIIKFYSGNFATVSYRPQLVVQYYVP